MSEPIFVDLETYWDKDVSLAKMPIEQYVRHPDFKIHMAGIQDGWDDKPVIVPFCDLAPTLTAMNYESRMVVAHNAKFDLYAIAHHCGLIPGYCGDTLAMAMWAYGNEENSHSLDELGWSKFGRGKFGKEVLTLTKGVPFIHTGSTVGNQLATYCKNDVALCAALFQKMTKDKEVSRYVFEIIDWTTRMYLEPKLELDNDTLEQVLRDKQADRHMRLMAAGVSQKELNSRAKFADILKAHGVQPPMKISDRTGQRTYAFAKNDPEFKALLKHPNNIVQALVDAKMNAGSSAVERRVERFIGAGLRGRWSVHLNAFGALNTSRHSGGDGLNAQNLDKKSGIRNAIMAPPNHDLVVVDSANIELRIAMWLAGQNDMIESIRNGHDPYCVMASRIYGRTITKEDETERFVGKVCLLALNYGMGLDKFVETLDSWGVSLDHSIIRNAFNVFRASMYCIPAMWKNCDRMLADIDRLKSQPDTNIRTAVYPSFLEPTARGLRFIPTGFIIKYPALLRCLHTRGGYEYKGRYGTVNIWGGKVFENICQATAAHIINEQTRVAIKSHDVAIQVHDELVVVAKSEDANATLADMILIMSASPSWFPDISLGASGAIAKRYGDAK